MPPNKSALADRALACLTLYLSWAQVAGWLQGLLSLALTCLSILWVAMQLYYKWRENRPKDG